MVNVKKHKRRIKKYGRDKFVTVKAHRRLTKKRRDISEYNPSFFVKAGEKSFWLRTPTYRGLSSGDMLDADMRAMAKADFRGEQKRFKYIADANVKDYFTRLHKSKRKNKRHKLRLTKKSHVYVNVPYRGGTKKLQKPSALAWNYDDYLGEADDYLGKVKLN